MIEKFNRSVLLFGKDDYMDAEGRAMHGAIAEKKVPVTVLTPVIAEEES